MMFQSSLCSCPLPLLISACFLLAGTGAACAQAPAAPQTAETVRVQIDLQTIVSRIAPDFIGFGYESSAVAQPNFFSAGNAPMIRLYRNLSLHGLIRIGGNVSDHTVYLPGGPAAAHTEQETTVLDCKSLEGLSEFARATGWKVMWGLNLGTGSKEQAAAEAVAVQAALGPQLHSFQIGNEVDLMPRFQDNYAAYHAAYLDYKAAVRAALPDAPFSGPDSAVTLDFVTRFAGSEAGDMTLLTHHYYRGGAPDPNSTLAKLLTPDNAWEARLTALQAICREQHVRYRINEVNSFWGGGKLGVSDTFGSALWCLDYMFLLASHGCDGVNMETDINQHGWVSFYSPIAHDASGSCFARPEYYGMLAFSLAGTGDILKLTLTKSDINFSAYTTRDDHGSLWVTLINKDLSRDAAVEVAVPQGYSTAGYYRLSAPSAESKDHVTLAGAEVSADGHWLPQPAVQVAVHRGTVRLPVTHAGAILLRLDGKAAQ